VAAGLTAVPFVFIHLPLAFLPQRNHHRIIVDLLGRLPVRPQQPCLTPHNLDQGVLHGVLGRREVGSALDEDTDHRGYEVLQHGLVHS
jgi:hypothetical protein